MAVFRTGNPALGEDTFRGVPRTGGSTMTLQGAVNKTGISLLIMMATATLTWNMENPILLLLLGLVGGLVVALATVFKKEWSPFTTPLYAALEGLVLGAISQRYEQQFEGIVPLAVGLTMGTLGALLLAYTSRLIKVTQN
ncbi:MAG: Bax inhibitor-1/YccA family protein, partial [Vicinamibacteria bacterium]